MENVNAYLFAWNSKYHPIENLLPLINKVKANQVAIDEWRISAYKKVRTGDRAFITRVGENVVKGIFASGTILSESHPIRKNDGSVVPGVDIKFDTFINPDAEQILDIEYVKKNTSLYQDWSPKKSGIKINPSKELELLWSKFYIEQNRYTDLYSAESLISEGASYQITQTVYERNRYARTICLQHYGYSCMVCGFNFRESYGDIGNEFIHVHHINQVSTGKRITDPIEDLRPVCPNCHAMLHKTNPPYTIGELKSRLR